MTTSKLIILSAKTSEQLYRKVQQLTDCLETDELTEKDFENICYTLQIGREHMDVRLAVVADSLSEAKDRLTDFLQQEDQGINIYYNVENELKINLVKGGDEVDTFICSLVNSRKISQVAELWAKGFDFNWDVLYRNSEAIPRRISLPTYPFEKERFWIRDALSASGQSNHELILYREDWVPEKIKEIGRKQYESIMVIIPPEMETSGLEKRIGAQKVLIVRQTDEITDLFKQVDHLDAVWYINGLAVKEIFRHMARLLKQIDRTGVVVDRILLFGYYEDAVEKSYLDGCIGFERSIRMFMPQTSFNVIFTARAQAGQIDVIEILQQEMSHIQHKSAWYDDGVRKVTLLTEGQPDDGPGLLRQGGVYCLLGGTGGLGRIFAQWLSQSYKARLIIMGRKAADELAEPTAGDSEYIQADILDKSAMSAAFSHIIKTYGKIDGILNCAGLAGGSSLIDKSAAEFEEIIRPNVVGTIILEEVAAEIEVGFIAYFCSSAAILGDFGSCCYAVGKRFQQSYVTGLESNLKRMIINWPLWQSDGMSFTDEQSNDYYLHSSGQKLMDAKNGINLFEKLLSRSRRQHLVLNAKRFKAERIIADLNRGRDSVVVSESNEPIPVTYKNSDIMEILSDADVVKLTEQDVRALITEITGIKSEKINAKADFAEMGFDSIALEQLIGHLRRQLGLSLTPDIFFNYPTVGKLVKYLIEKYREQLYQIYSPEKEPEPIPQSVGEDIRMDQEKDHKRISIIGISGRFPEARDVNELWTILETGQDVTRDISGHRPGWEVSSANGAATPGRRKLGVVPGIYEFDPLFFAISPNEAEQMDPRQRLLLEETWKALEDASYGRSLLNSERIGVFVGAEESDFGTDCKTRSSISATSMSALAGRIGYFFDLKGPGMVIDTACSSALVAFSQACLMIEAGQCDAAIVAGVSILTTPTDYELMEKSKMISPDGRCYTFDKRANGMIPAESVAVVILKRESKAVADGQPIYANVVGHGINYDGKTNGLTAPSGNSQKDLIKEIYQRFQLDRAGTDLIITHGTGTKLGDSIEINALSEAFSGDSKEKHCALISFKPNIGHALAASGLVSVIGLLMAMKNEKIPATIHCEEVNEYINWERSPFYLNTSLREWKRTGRKQRRAGISSFGITGTNVHVITEEAEQMKQNEPDYRRPYYAFCISSQSPAGLIQNMSALKERLVDLTDDDLASVSYTLSRGRMHLQNRAVIIASDFQRMIGAIDRFLAGEQTEYAISGKVPNDVEPDETRSGPAAVSRPDSEATAEEYLRWLKELAADYCCGYDDEIGRAVWTNGRPRYIRLPTYNFQNKEYKISHTDGIIAEQAQKSEPKGRQDEVTIQATIYDDDEDTD